MAGPTSPTSEAAAQLLVSPLEAGSGRAPSSQTVVRDTMSAALSPSSPLAFMPPPPPPSSSSSSSPSSQPLSPRSRNLDALRRRASETQSAQPSFPKPNRRGSDGMLQNARVGREEKESGCTKLKQRIMDELSDGTREEEIYAFLRTRLSGGNEDMPEMNPITFMMVVLQRTDLRDILLEVRASSNASGNGRWEELITMWAEQVQAYHGKIAFSGNFAFFEAHVRILCEELKIDNKYAAVLNEINAVILDRNEEKRARWRAFVAWLIALTHPAASTIARRSSGGRGGAS